MFSGIYTVYIFFHSLDNNIIIISVKQGSKMLTLETMWKLHTISEKNKTVFQDLCQTFEQSPGVFQCKHQLESDGFAISRKEDINKDSTAYKQRVERSPSKRVNLDKAEDTSTFSKRTTLNKAEIPSKTSETTGNKTTYIKALQTKLMASLNCTEMLDRDLYKAVDSADVCRCDAAQVDDDILMQVCKKSEKYNSSSISVLGKFLLLPKVLYCQHLYLIVYTAVLSLVKCQNSQFSCYPIFKICKLMELIIAMKPCPRIILLLDRPFAFP